MTLPEGKRPTVYGKTRKEVADKINQMLTEVQQGLPVTAGDKLTVGEYLTRWLEDSVKPSVRRRTFEGYEQIVKQHLLPALDKVAIQKLTAADLQKLYADKLKVGLSASTVGHIHAVAHRALEQAASGDWWPGMSRRWWTDQGPSVTRSSR